MAKDKKGKTVEANGSATNGAAAAAPTPAPGAPVQPGLPALYGRIEFLNAGVHGKVHYLPQSDFGFASTTNYIPLTVMEFADAAAFYPIVFAGAGETVEPVAILGRSNGENQFVEKDGKWKAGTYIPAYVRRHPFILISNPNDQSLSLGADLTAGNLREGEAGQALYVDGKPSDTAKRALQFCLAYQQAAVASGAICRAIEASGILIDRSAEFSLPSGKSRVTGFRIIDEAAFNKLGDDQFLELRKVGALPVIYSHLLSMKAWRNLLN